MMTKEKELNALLPIVGALWVAGSAAASSAQIINGRRDVIMLGFMDGRPLSMLHRQTILHDDWVPMVIVTILSGLVLTAFFIIAPIALNLNRSYKILCFVCAATPAVGLMSWCLQGIAEYNMMQSLLATEAAAAAG